MDTDMIKAKLFTYDVAQDIYRVRRRTTILGITVPELNEAIYILQMIIFDEKHNDVGEKHIEAMHLNYTENRDDVWEFPRLITSVYGIDLRCGTKRQKVIKISRSGFRKMFTFVKREIDAGAMTSDLSEIVEYHLTFMACLVGFNLEIPNHLSLF